MLKSRVLSIETFLCCSPDFLLYSVLGLNEGKVVVCLPLKLVAKEKKIKPQNFTITCFLFTDIYGAPTISQTLLSSSQVLLTLNLITTH